MPAEYLRSSCRIAVAETTVGKRDDAHITYAQDSRFSHMQDKSIGDFLLPLVVSSAKLCQVVLLLGESCIAVLAVDRLKLFEIAFSDLHVMETVLHLLPIISKRN